VVGPLIGLRSNIQGFNFSLWVERASAKLRLQTKQHFSFGQKHEHIVELK